MLVALYGHVQDLSETLLLSSIFKHLLLLICARLVCALLCTESTKWLVNVDEMVGLCHVDVDEVVGLCHVNVDEVVGL